MSYPQPRCHDYAGSWKLAAIHMIFRPAPPPTWRDGPMYHVNAGDLPGSDTSRNLQGVAGEGG